MTLKLLCKKPHEVNNPSSYQPKSRASFKPQEKTKKVFTTKKVPEGKKKKGQKRNEHSHDVEGDDEQIAQKINIAAEIMSKGNVQMKNSRSTGQNPLTLIFTNGLGI